MRQDRWLYKKNVQVSDFLGIPQDVALGEPVITMTGRRELYVENYQRIIRFSEKEICLQAKTCKIIVLGKRLRIEYYTKDDMLISGQIQIVETEG